MSNSDLGQFNDTTKLSDKTRREISEFVERSDHYDSVEEFIEDATRYQIELLQQTTDAAQQPIMRTNSIVLRLLTMTDRAVAELHRLLLKVIQQYISLISRSEDHPSVQPKPQSRTTAAEKMELYHQDTDNRTYQQRTEEMRSLLKQENLSAAEIEQKIQESEDE